MGLQNRPPSWVHPLGTDLYSRDLLSRLVYGARVSLAVGALAMVVAVTVGAVIGLLAGYFRRWLDGALMRLVDVGLAIPRIFLLLMAVALWDRLPLGTLVLVIGLTGWFATSRLVRAEVLSLRERAYVDAARALGAPPARVMFRHILPNALAPLIVSAALGIGNVMLLEASLSFLGIGVAPPTPSWGNMIADGKDQLATAPWTTPLSLTSHRRTVRSWPQETIQCPSGLKHAPKASAVRRSALPLAALGPSPPERNVHPLRRKSQVPASSTSGFCGSMVRLEQPVDALPA